LSAKQRHTADDIDFRAIERRFRLLNSARLARVRAELNERQGAFFDLLPLLFHVNHPTLPGFASVETPAGLFGYQPDQETLAAARTIARSFQYQKPSANRVAPLLALYVMGSAGTVAYAGQSDLDVWVCHDPQLSERAVALLQQKATAISQWAEELGLEVHFFIVNPERLRRGELQSLSDESSGTAQHSLLLDEFYRSSLLLAGQAPLWWLVPPQREAEYESYVSELVGKRFVHAKDHIDFGGLAQIPAEEFFGAALWQLYKGIDSPYKSVLKLLLIEAYASEYPQIDLLALRYKHAVYSGERSPDRLEPYINMLEKVEEYLSAREDRGRIELARRCFYFKVDAHLGSEESNPDWRRQLLEGLAHRWGWGRADLLVMDGRESWKAHRVSEERRRLFDALTTSYRALSDFARNYAGLSLISQRDLTILGRKLYAAFERKAGKVELINRGIVSDMWEANVTLHELVGEDRQSRWLLFRGAVPPERMHEEIALKRSRHLVELIAWGYFNRVLDRRTTIAVHSATTQLGSTDLRRLAEQMQHHFPLHLLEQSTMEDYAGPARVLHAAIFVNPALDRFSTLAINRANAANNPDPLSYGGSRENLVHELSLVLLTSWREALVYEFAGNRGLMDCICEYYKWAPLSKGEAPPRVEVHGASAARGLSVARRVDQLFRDITTTYYGAAPAAGARYVLAVRRGYYLLRFDGDTPRYEWLEGESGLFRALGAPQPAFSPVFLDRYAAAGTALPLIYGRNRAGYVQLFYRPRGTEVEIYILDERGSLFFERLPYDQASGLVSQFSRFFEAVLNRINFLMQEGQSVAGAEGVEFHRIGEGKDGTLQLERQPPEFLSSAQRYFSLQVIVDVNEQGQTEFTLYCDDHEFSSMEYGRDLFASVARYVLELRRSGQRYPIYITDISMSRAVLGDDTLGRVQTIHFLKYKHSIEEKLNRGLPDSE